MEHKGKNKNKKESKYDQRSRRTLTTTGRRIESTRNKTFQRKKSKKQKQRLQNKQNDS